MGRRATAEWPLGRPQTLRHWGRWGGSAGVQHRDVGRGDAVAVVPREEGGALGPCRLSACSAERCHGQFWDAVWRS
eukprot:5383460-Pleurochrysis_carterae.AAC.1